MFGGFAHLEVLGPRKRLDRWLAGLQDHGGCHLADALVDLEGESGLGRPLPDDDERRSRHLRAEAAYALRSIARLLPARGRPAPVDGLGAPPEEASARPSWQIGPGGVDDGRVVALRNEAVERAGEIREALEAVREAEDAVEHVDAIVTALGILEAAGRTRIAGEALVLPEGTRGVRTILRRLRRMGVDPRKDDARRGVVVWLAPREAEAGQAAPDPAQVERAVQGLADHLGARVQVLPDAGSERPVADVLREHRAVRDAALADEQRARETLRAAVAEQGAAARWLLDSIKDAEARDATWAQLGATEHVVAARVFVRAEDRDTLLDQLKRDHGDRLVVRALAPRDDAPSTPQEVAPAPLAALRDLAPDRFGLGASTRYLALAMPIVAGLVGADVVLGIALCIVGLLLGLGTRRASPRRDMAALSIVSGGLCLLFGLLAGVALGDRGSWGLWPAAGSLLAPAGGIAWGVFAALLHGLAYAAFALVLYGLPLTLIAWRGDHLALARRRAVLVLELGTVGCLGMAAGGYASAGWLLAAAVIVAVSFAALGPAGFVRRYLVDLVGYLRLVAVGGFALLVAGLGLDLVTSGGLQTIIAPVLVGLGCFALILDASQLAMGVPHDLPLGGQRYLRPFRPLSRRGVGGGQ